MRSRQWISPTDWKTIPYVAAGGKPAVFKEVEISYPEAVEKKKGRRGLPRFSRKRSMSISKRKVSWGKI